MNVVRSGRNRVQFPAAMFRVFAYDLFGYEQNRTRSSSTSSAQATRPGVSTLVPKGRHVVATGANPWIDERIRFRSPEGAT